MTIFRTTLFELFVVVHAAIVATLSSTRASSSDLVPSRKLKKPSTCDWRQVGDDLDGEEQGDQLGASVAFSKDGSTVAVGSPGGLFTSLLTPGRVRIYLVRENSLVQLGNSIDGEVSGDQAGGSVALSDDGRTLAIGSNRNDDAAVNAGQARVYKYDGDWYQLGQDIEGEAEEDYSGISVALNSNGTLLAVGATGNDGSDAVNSTEADRGHVRVYRLDDANRWVKLGADIDGWESGSELGASVALSADGLVLVASAPRSDANGLEDSGEVVVFRHESTVWKQVGSRLSGEAAGDWFGTDVSISADGKTIAAGAWLNDSNGPFSGHARIFSLVDNEWEQLGNTIVGESDQDQAGHSVSLSSDGRTLAVGAIRNDGRNGINSGHVRVFTLNESDWVQIGLDIDGEAGEDYFGISASLAGDGASLVIGGIGNDKNGIDSGHARVFSLDVPCPEAKEARIEEITLQFTGVPELNPSENAHFEMLTEDWYEAYFGKDETISATGVRNLATSVSVRNQNVEKGTHTNNTLTYDQNFTFVEMSDSVMARDLVLLPFQDAMEVELYRELLAESISAFSSVQSPVGPPELPTQESGPTPVPSPMSGTGGLSIGAPSPMPETDGFSKGGIAGIAFATLVLGLAVAGLFMRRYNGSRNPFQEGLSDLPIGEVIDTSNTIPPASARTATDSTVEAIAVDVLDAEPSRLPEFKDQVCPDPDEAIPSSTTDASVKATKDEVPLDFKDQVGAYGEHLGRNEDLTHVSEEQIPANNGPDFKDEEGASALNK